MGFKQLIPFCPSTFNTISFESTLVSDDEVSNSPRRNKNIDKIYMCDCRFRTYGNLSLLYSVYLRWYKNSVPPWKPSNSCSTPQITSIPIPCIWRLSITCTISFWDYLISKLWFWRKFLKWLDRGQNGTLTHPGNRYFKLSAIQFPSLD